ncbi:MAG: hypothetical protein IKL04_09770 [Lachnospiraceae bacterium]|nr:hypothetical protein [Lachnospiraceae bacterium]
MSKFERKFGKYAIKNLTAKLIGCYVVGYIIQMILISQQKFEGILWLTLEPNSILHGQIWRLVSWLLIPPGILSTDSMSNLFFTLIMLYFYYSIGTSLERTWGTYRYNVYLLGGMLITILAAFISMPVVYLQYGKELFALRMLEGSFFFSTYYVNMSIFLAFAATFPNAQVLLMFFIPIKVKWMGIIYAVLLVYEAWMGNIFTRFAIGASLLNFGLFYLSTRRHLSPAQIKRRMVYKQEVRKSRPKITGHKCAVCGRTEEDDPGLEFRFCSKCNGNYEYCQDHLFTHEHVK